MLLALATLVDRVRIRPVRLMWYAGIFRHGYVWSIGFLMLVIGGIFYAGFVKDGIYLYLGLGYLVGAVFWCVAMRLSSATIVTDFALIRQNGKAGRILSWSQVSDFFVRREGKRWLYVFFYLDENGLRSRFEVRVPEAYRHVFQRMVHQHVERGKMSVPERAYG